MRFNFHHIVPLDQVVMGSDLYRQLHCSHDFSPLLFLKKLVKITTFNGGEDRCANTYGGKVSFLLFLPELEMKKFQTEKAV